MGTFLKDCRLIYKTSFLCRYQKKNIVHIKQLILLKTYISLAEDSLLMKATISSGQTFRTNIQLANLK